MSAVLTRGGAVQGVVQQLAGQVEVEVEAGRDVGHQLLLHLGEDGGQEELSPGGGLGHIMVMLDGQMVEDGQ